MVEFVFPFVENFLLKLMYSHGLIKGAEIRRRCQEGLFWSDGLNLELVVPKNSV